MAMDDHGIRADVVIDPPSIMNRMNPSQIYQQFLCRGALLIQQRIQNMPWQEAYDLIMSYIGDINPKWREVVEATHQSDIQKQDLVEESKKKGIQLQVSPFQEGIDTEFILKLAEKYNIDKTPVTFKVKQADGTLRTIRTKQAVMIGPEYIHVLYKMPHQSTAGFGYVNQYHSPVRPSAFAKTQDPYARTTIRAGEDEGRNIVMGAGAETATRILGLYANTESAVSSLIRHLLFDKDPMNLPHIEMDTNSIIKANSIIGVTRHMFSTIGIDIVPPVTVGLENDPYSNLELPTE